MQFKKILVPVDGSDAANHALQYGFRMAETHGAFLYVLAVADVGEAAYPLMHVNLNRNGFSSVKEKAEAFMNTLKTKMPADAKWEPVIRVGIPGNVITSMVEDEDIDLVIMGNSGKGSISSFIMGSVSQYVIHHVKVPVMIIK